MPGNHRRVLESMVAEPIMVAEPMEKIMAPFQPPSIATGPSLSTSAVVDERRDAETSDRGSQSCPTTTGFSVPSYASSIDPLAEDSRPTLGSISKDIVRSINNSVGRNGPQNMVSLYRTDCESRDGPPSFPSNSLAMTSQASSSIQKVVTGYNTATKAIQESALVENINTNFRSTVETIGGSMRQIRSSSLSTSLSTSLDVNRSSSERGIFTSQSDAWGSIQNAGAEISTFTSTKVAPLFRRKSTTDAHFAGKSYMPGFGSRSLSSSIGGKKEVSFDYQLFQDKE